MDDLKIIESCLLGNTQVFSRLIDNYKNMVYNLARDRFKKKELNYVSLDAPVETDDSEFYPQPADLTNNPEQIIAQKENLQAIQQAIHSLPLKYREVVVLRHLQDLSYIEISNILKLPSGTVKIRLYRARAFTAPANN
jgi:RNA polymerase sigma-70 factor (ECF subfamily)